MSPLIFLDLETTGIDASRNHILEVAALAWENGKILGRFENLVNPRVPVPHEITILTGIRNEDVSGALLFSEIKDSLRDFIGSAPIVGHNIPFDTGFLKTHHLHLENPLIDTMHLARILLLKEPSYALEVLMKKYKLPLRDSHRAMADVETSVAFFEFLLQRMAEIPKEAAARIKEVMKKSDWAGKAAMELGMH